MAKTTWPAPNPLESFGRLRRFLGQDAPKKAAPAEGGVRDPLASAGELLSEVPAKAEHHLRFFSLNIAHGRSTATHQALLKPGTAERNVTAIADVIRNLEADVVALQEADGPSSWSGNFDHVATLAKHAGLADHVRGNHNPFSLGRFQLESGTALLARLPLADKGDHPFKTVWRDTKGFVVAALRVPHWGNFEIDVASVHLDFLRPGVRRRQILQMVEILKNRRRPLVLLGDFNVCFRRDNEALRLFEDMLGVHACAPENEAPTFPSIRPRRRLDWVLATSDIHFAEYHTLSTPLSDHLGIVADLALPPSVLPTLDASAG